MINNPLDINIYNACSLVYLKIASTSGPSHLANLSHRVLLKVDENILSVGMSSVGMSLKLNIYNLCRCFFSFYTNALYIQRFMDY